MLQVKTKRHFKRINEESYAMSKQRFIKHQLNKVSIYYQVNYILLWHSEVLQVFQSVNIIAISDINVVSCSKNYYSEKPIKELQRYWN